ncbi:MAG TPA: cytochrome c3 family protein [Haliangiales bacterium]|nr:cytochrome c3 family protein [Haliangiales bacterium]
MDRYIFPRWSNKVLPFVFFFVLGPAATAAVGGLWYYGTNKHIEVGFEPVQPVEYSHKLHAGELGMDCRYCHYTAERSYFAAVPPTETCMNCHWKVRTDSLLLLPVRESYATDKPIPWVRIHNLPDFAYFNHSAHLAAGVACQSCHGRIDAMVRVHQDQPLSMGWCLECHRDPAPHIRDPGNVTKMLDTWPDLSKSGQKPVAANGRELHPPTWCSGCHR